MLLRPWACAPCANVIARKIPGPAAGATTYVEREPAQAENLRQAEEGLDIPLKGLQTALTWAHDFAAKTRFRRLARNKMACYLVQTGEPGSNLSAPRGSSWRRRRLGC